VERSGTLVKIQLAQEHRQADQNADRDRVRAVTPRVKRVPTRLSAHVRAVETGWTWSDDNRIARLVAQKDLPCHAAGLWGLSNGKRPDAIAWWFTAERL
jgi:hypothetical protein